MGSRRKVAPWLTAFVMAKVDDGDPEVRANWRAELRAMKDCVRTLDALHSAMEEPPSAVVACWRDSAGRALARLSRVSGPKERGGG